MLNVFNRPAAVDFNVFQRLFGAVIGHQWLGLLVINRQTLAHGTLGIVLTLL